MKVALLICLLGCGAAPALSQAESAAPDGELFRFARSSDFIATGYVEEVRPTSKRLDGRPLDDLSKTLGGVLYVFRVEKILCARTDFEPGTSRAQEPERLYIFKKRDSRFFQEEVYNQNQRYLIFLSALQGQSQLAKQYNLQSGETYYEAFEGKRGLIALTSDDLPQLSNVRQFCKALRPADAQKKLRRLYKLMQSTDPDLRESAAEAIKIIEAKTSR